MPEKVLLAVITDGRTEMNLQCCISILHTQIDLMTAKEGNAFVAELEFFEKLNDALDALHKNKTLSAMFAIRWNTLVPGAFALTAFSSKEKVVVAPSPRVGVDWAKVRDRALNKENKEPLHHAGNVYNVKLEGLPRADGYTSVKELEWVDAIFVRREVVDDIAARHPDVVSEQKSAFALDGVYGGKFASASKRFVQLYGGVVWADVEHQCAVSGPFDYVGCVGSRRVLR